MSQLEYEGGFASAVSQRSTARAGWAARGFDVVLCAALLVFLAPLLIIIGLVVGLEGPGPVFFAHRRIGRDGKPFHCLKFRSMSLDAEERLHAYLEENAEARAEWEQHHKLRNDPRVTRAGHFLRKSSLDELPQLFNVLRGDMSLVGPRPIVDAEVRRYGAGFTDYCSVRPGMTGPWQVSGRSDVDYETRVALDVSYARSKSVLLDVRILLLTIPAVLQSKGSY